jgi:cytochrome c556
MKRHLLTVLAATTLAASLAFAADEPNPIKDSMKYSHKAPKGEKKISEKIVEGTATNEEVKKTLELYLAIGDTKPPKGDAADFKARMAKLITATEEVVAKKPDAPAHYKEAVNCKACHSEHKGD